MQEKQRHGEALQHAVNLAGGRAALGRAVAEKMKLEQPVTRHAIFEWGKAPPPKYCLAIEAVTGVSRHELRPDIFGDPEPNPKRAAEQVAA